MDQERIQFIGLNDLESPEQDIVNKLATKYHDKIKRTIKKPTSLVVHIKQYTKEGKSHKYSIHVRAIAPTRIFESTVSDWDLAKSLHKVFEEIEHEIHHQLKTDSQHKKPYER